MAEPEASNTNTTFRATRPIETFPAELLEEIASYIGYDDAYSFAMTCRAFYNSAGKALHAASLQVPNLSTLYFDSDFILWDFLELLEAEPWKLYFIRGIVLDEVEFTANSRLDARDGEEVCREKIIRYQTLFTRACPILEAPFDPLDEFITEPGIAWEIVGVALWKIPFLKRIKIVTSTGATRVHRMLNEGILQHLALTMQQQRTMRGQGQKASSLVVPSPSKRLTPCIIWGMFKEFARKKFRRQQQSDDTLLDADVQHPLLSIPNAFNTVRELSVTSFRGNRLSAQNIFRTELLVKKLASFLPLESLSITSPQDIGTWYQYRTAHHFEGPINITPPSSEHELAHAQYSNFRQLRYLLLAGHESYAENGPLLRGIIHAAPLLEEARVFLAKPPAIGPMLRDLMNDLIWAQDHIAAHHGDYVFTPIVRLFVVVNGPFEAPSRPDDEYCYRFLPDTSPEEYERAVVQTNTELSAHLAQMAPLPHAFEVEVQAIYPDVVADNACVP